MKTMMSWSLRPISKIGFILLFLFFGSNQIIAQSKTDFSYGLSVNLGYGLAVTNNEDYQKYTDTINSNSTRHFNKGAHVWFNYSLGKKYDLQIGLGFQQIGFARKQTNLNFKNYTYPGIGTGRIEDLSNAEKEITYNYRFNYIEVPLILNTYLGRSNDFKWIYHFTAGITPQILVNHKLVANCNPGFSINGEDQFKFDSTGFSGRLFAMNLQIGMLIENKVSKNKTYFIQPIIGYYPLSITSNANTANPFYFSVNLGIKLASFKNGD